MQKRKAITTAEVAAIIGRSPQYVRVAMQKGILHIGECFQNKSSYCYDIVPALLAEREGITVEELDRRLESIRA